MDYLDTIPATVQAIREFSGKREEYSAWRRSVERVLALYEPISSTSRLLFILHVIRSKITGEADTALECYRVPLNWQQMKQCLNMHYGDNRDFGTLEYQMTALRQGSQTFNEFYQTIYKYLSLILDKLSDSKLDETSISTMINTYRQKALKTFIKGLNGDLPRLLTIKEPTSLPHALQLCNDLDNMSKKWKRYPDEPSNADSKQLTCYNCKRKLNGDSLYGGMHLYTHFPKSSSNTTASTTTTCSAKMILEQFQKNFQLNASVENTYKEPPIAMKESASIVDIKFRESKVSSLPYFQAVVKGDQPSTFLLDTSRNSNFIKSDLVTDVTLNDPTFYITTNGEDIEVTHHVYINLFGSQYPPVKFYLLPNLEPFDGILGYKSLQELSAVVDASENCIILKGGNKIKLKQHIDKVKEWQRLQDILQKNSLSESRLTTDYLNNESNNTNDRTNTISLKC